MKATITSKGQVTIPVSIRRRLDLRAGQILEFDERAPFLMATRAFDPEEMFAVIGCCKDEGGPTPTGREWLDQTRGKVELPKRTDAGGD